MAIKLRQIFGPACKRFAVVAGLLAAGSPASAFEFNPYHSNDVGPITWTGFIFNPSISYDTLDFKGKAGRFLNDPEGFRAGAEVGYDKQIGSFVVGVALDLYKSFADSNREPGVANLLNAEFDAQGTVRGRIGYSFGRTLVYGTGGFAYGRLRISDATLNLSESKTLTGWAAGGGLEYVYNKNITIRAEYQRIDLGDEKYSSLNSVGNPNVGITNDVINIGIVSRF